MRERNWTFTFYYFYFCKTITSMNLPVSVDFLDSILLIFIIHLQLIMNFLSSSRISYFWETLQTYICRTLMIDSQSTIKERQFNSSIAISFICCYLYSSLVFPTLLFSIFLLSFSSYYSFFWIFIWGFSIWIFLFISFLFPRAKES